MSINQKYTYNKNCFKKINPVSCYWAGFLAGDGYIRDKNKGDPTTLLSIQIGVKDVGHLQNFKNFTGYSGPITKVSQKFSGGERIDIRSCDDLLIDLEEKFGIVTGKKNRFLPESLFNKRDNFMSYLIGLIDADGSIYSHRTNKNNKIITLGSTPKLIKPILVELNYSHIKIEKQATNFYRARIQRREVVEEIFDYSRKLNLPLLQRKWAA